MFTSTVREQNGHYVIDVPKEEVDRLGLRGGQKVLLNMFPAEPEQMAEAQLETIITRLVQEHREALDHLAT